MNARSLRRGGRLSTRGMGIAALVVVLALVNLVVIGSVAAASDESNVGVMRLQSVQAFYAAEAGGMVVAKVSSALTATPGLGAADGEELSLPATGSIVTLSNQAVIQYTQLPAALADGVAVVHGRAGACARRVQITLGQE